MPSRRDIAAYLDVTTPMPSEADLIFVPGTRLAEPANIAAHLLRARIASTVLLTGGVITPTGETEAAALRRVLLANGAAEDAVIVDHTSTNTFENVAHGWAILQSRTPEVPRRVIAVCKWWHSRRVLMTLKAGFPPGTRYHAVTYAPDGLTHESWVHSSKTWANCAVMKEWRCIPRYLPAGNLSEIRQADDGSWV